MKEIHIRLDNGTWLINGKKYKDLDRVEKNFFDEFLIAMRLGASPENEKIINNHKYEKI